MCKNIDWLWLLFPFCLKALNKILDWTKLEVFPDNKTNITHMFSFVFDRVENIAGKGENGYQHFLL